MQLSQEEIVGYLRRVSAFKKLVDEQAEELAKISQVRQFARGDELFKQGDKNGGVYIVVSGKVIIERELDRNNSSVSLMVAKPVESLGEMSLFVDAPRSVTATALENTVTLWIDNDDFVSFISRYPDLLLELCKVLSQRLVEAYDKIAEVTLNRKPRELRKLYDKLDF